MRLGDVAAVFDREGIPSTIVATESPDHLNTTVTTEIRDGRRRFVVVGGDGTAHLVVNALMEADLPESDRLTLSIIATGSGSDFVRTFGHKKGLTWGVSRLHSPDIYPIDVGLLTGSFGERFFLNALNVGVAAASAKRAETFPRRVGSLRYVVGFWVALAGFSQGTVSVGIDHHTFRGNAINVVVANGQYFGGGMNIAPRASLTDGLFDVQVFAGPRRRAFSVMPRVMRGTHLSLKAVRRYIGSDVHITVPDHWPVEADGEILGTGPIIARVIPSAIDFVA